MRKCCESENATTVEPPYESPFEESAQYEYAQPIPINVIIDYPEQYSYVEIADIGYVAIQ